MKIVLVRRVDVILSAVPKPVFPNYVAVSDEFAADEACIRWRDDQQRAYPMRNWDIDFSESKMEIIEHLGATKEEVQDKIDEARWYEKEVLGYE